MLIFTGIFLTVNNTYLDFMGWGADNLCRNFCSVGLTSYTNIENPIYVLDIIVRNFFNVTSFLSPLLP